MNIDQNQAAVGRIVDKVWGQTRCLIRGHGFEVHYLSIKPGGYCSRHKHRAKWNQFFVIRGLLKVVFFKADGTEDHHFTLSAGGLLSVPPGIIHRFDGLEASEAIETYWTDPVNPSDIERIDQGGFVPVWVDQASHAVGEHKPILHQS